VGGGRRLGGGLRGGGGLGGGFTSRGFLARGAGVSGGACVACCGLVFASRFDGALASAHLVLRQTAGRTTAATGALRRTRLERGVVSALGRRRRGQVAGRRGVRTRPLGFDHHRLGAAVAEALLHDAGAHRALTGLQRDGRSPAGVPGRPLSFSSLMRSLVLPPGGAWPKTVRSM
jgi:hypothetical protein